MISFLTLRLRKIELQGDPVELLHCNVLFDDETEFLTFPTDTLQRISNNHHRHIQSSIIEQCKILRYNSTMPDVSSYLMVQLSTYAVNVSRQGEIPLDYLQAGDTIEILHTPFFEGLRFRILDVIDSDIQIGVNISFPMSVWLLNVPVDNILVRNS